MHMYRIFLMTSTNLWYCFAADDSPYLTNFKVKIGILIPALGSYKAPD